MDAPQLTVRHVSKTFPGTKALDDVDLDVAPAEVHALVGANGSGKSTFVKILAGVHDPDPGATAEVRGAPFQLGNVTAAQRAGLRFVHQDVGLVPNLDTCDNLALGTGFTTAAGGRISWRRQRAHAREAIHSLGYDFDVTVPVGELTPSQRTGIAIARALQGWQEQASLLVLDEPTASLPKPEAAKLFDVVRRVKALGVSVIYISHHLDEVFAVADVVSVLRDGRRVDTRPVGRLTKDELVHLMVGEVIDATPTHRTARADHPVLVTRQLSGRRLHGLDLTVHAGEVVGIAGITGSGRDEVAPMLFGGRPRHGSVSVGGRELPPMRPDLAISHGLGMVPANRHEHGVVLDMTVLENLTLADLRPYWQRLVFRSHQERADGQSWLGRMTVRPQRTEPRIATLSGGNQQKVVIGKWLRLEPAALILDEPTQGVDIASKAEIYRLIDEAAEEGMAVVVCSSDEGELERLCHRVIVLDHGTVAAELKGTEVSASRIAQLSLGALSLTGSGGAQE